MDDSSAQGAPLPWPDLLRIAFGPGEPAHLNACVGWVLSRPTEMFGYIEGYRRAASALFELAETRSTSPDYVVFPIAFLWRHHVELALKEIIAQGRQLHGDEWSFPTDEHRLGKLWEIARSFAAECGDPKADELFYAGAMIAELHTIDPSAQGFRYPVAKDLRTRSLPKAPDLVNLAALHDSMVALANFLSGVSSVLSQRLDQASQHENPRE